MNMWQNSHPTKKRTGLYPETKVQIAVCQYIKTKYPKASNYIIKIDNEGAYSKGGNIARIRAGLNRGAADLFIAYPVKQYHGMWLELKRDGWRLTESQRHHYNNQMLFLDNMSKQGYFSQFAVGLDEAINCVDNYFIYKD